MRAQPPTGIENVNIPLGLDEPAVCLGFGNVHNQTEDLFPTVQRYVELQVRVYSSSFTVQASTSPGLTKDGTFNLPDSAQGAAWVTSYFFFLASETKVSSTAQSCDKVKSQQKQFTQAILISISDQSTSILQSVQISQRVSDAGCDEVFGGTGFTRATRQAWDASADHA